MTTVVPLGVEIGIALTSDRDAALRLLVSAVPLDGDEHGRGAPRTGRAGIRRVLVARVAAPGTSAIVARATGRIVGAVLMTALDGEPWLVGPLGVAVTSRGRGVGTSLLQVCRARLDAAGEPAVAFACTPAAARFYGAFGFAASDLPTPVGVPVRPLRRPASRSREEHPS
jgi:GNAT superfamily N-acetyltransferase